MDIPVKVLLVTFHWSWEVQEEVDVDGHISKGYTEFYNCFVIGTGSEVHKLWR